MREELTNEELIQLYDATFSNINTQFELWITITFAVIIASYIAGHRLERSLQYLIAALYSAVSLLLLLMLVSAVNFAGEFDAFGVQVQQDPLTVMIVFLRVGVWILGTVATLVFIFKRGKDNATAQVEDEH